jgi:hypothetical protein
MDRQGVLPDQTIVTRGAYIVLLGPSSKVKVPNNTTVIEGKGKFVMPGLIDMNVQILGEEELPLYLANGVTTVLNLNGRSAHIGWRKRIESGALLGPNIISTGPRYFSAKTLQEGKSAVDSQANAGFDAVFAYSGMNNQTFKSVVSEAKAKGMLVFGSIPRASGLLGVAEAKVPIIKTEEVMNSYLAASPDLQVGINNAAKIISDSKVPLVASFVSGIHTLRQAESLPMFLQRTPIHYLAPWQRELWMPGENVIQKRFGDKQFHGSMVSGLENQRELIRQIHRFGGNVLVGTDANSVGVVPGFSIVEEIQNLQKLGLTNYQALRSATVDSARALNRTLAVGSISSGKRADLLLLDRNPLTDLANLKTLNGVMCRGYWNPSMKLKKAISEIPLKYSNLLAKGTRAIRNGPATLKAFNQECDPNLAMTKLLLVELVKTDGESGLSKFYSQLAVSDPKDNLNSENNVNSFGYWLLTTKKQTVLAIKVFKVNLQRHPGSANMYDSLAEGYAILGDKPKAIQFYRQALKVDPNFSSSSLALKKLGAK